jgi:hypothetical protein
MLDVRPARNALIAVCVQFNHLIYIPMLAPTKCNMHGRRVFDVLLSLDHVFSVIHCSDQAEFHIRFQRSAPDIHQDCRAWAASMAKYVRIMSAPARLMAVRVSIITFGPSIQPIFSAALIMENSPLTL